MPRVPRWRIGLGWSDKVRIPVRHGRVLRICVKLGIVVVLNLLILEIPLPGVT